MAEVKVKNVSKLFGKVVAVKDFTLNIEDGEFVILVGPSGCGKTTTLRSIAGLEEVTGGEIYIGDRLVNDVPPKDRDVAMVFQNYALYPHMDVYRNMSFGLRLRRTPKDEIDKIVRRTAKMLGIAELLNRKPKELSGGQRQRVALGRAIVRDPRVFLFDEPLSNLDAKLRIAMRAELLDLHRRLKTTTIYVTHDQLEAMTMGDRIVVMNDGLIQQVDSPQQVYDHPANRYVAGFVGSPAMNFLPCTTAKKNGDFYANSDSFNLKIPSDKTKLLADYVGKSVILGIRPEHITIRSQVKECDPETVFKGSVWVTEPLGSEKLVYVKNGQHTIVTRQDPHVEVKTGEDVDLVAEMAFSHVFDEETEKTVY